MIWYAVWPFFLDTSVSNTLYTQSKNLAFDRTFIARLPNMKLYLFYQWRSLIVGAYLLGIRYLGWYIIGYKVRTGKLDAKTETFEALEVLLVSAWAKEVH